MSDLIKREDVVKEFGRVFGDLGLTLFGVGGNDLAQVIANAIPSAERKGEWIRTFDGNEWYWYCSNCKEQWCEEDLWMGGNEFPHFCPHCGARMKGAEDE